MSTTLPKMLAAAMLPAVVEASCYKNNPGPEGIETARETVDLYRYKETDKIANERKSGREENSGWSGHIGYVAENDGDVWRVKIPCKKDYYNLLNLLSNSASYNEDGSTAPDIRDKKMKPYVVWECCRKYKPGDYIGGMARAIVKIGKGDCFGSQWESTPECVVWTKTKKGKRRKEEIEKSIKAAPKEIEDEIDEEIKKIDDEEIDDAIKEDLKVKSVGPGSWFSDFLHAEGKLQRGIRTAESKDDLKLVQKRLSAAKGYVMLLVQAAKIHTPPNSSALKFAIMHDNTLGDARKWRNEIAKKMKVLKEIEEQTGANKRQEELEREGEEEATYTSQYDDY